MNLGRRTVYCLVISLLCANVLVRFPYSDHETGADSFFIHSLSTTITERHYMPWVLNPLGYFGWYPLSYPSAGPIVISGVSQTAGITGEGAILVLSGLYGILGVLAAFMMARAFRRDDVFALIVAAVFSLAPRFVVFTQWSASSRNLFMTLIPVFIWGLVRAYRRPTVSNVAIPTSVLLLMIATHRLTILLAVVVIASVVAYVFLMVHRIMRIQWPKYLLSRSFRRWIPVLALVWIFAIAVVMIAGTGVLGEYSAGEICSGPTTIDQLCNLGVSITRSVGLALPFALVGIFEVVRIRNKSFLEAFLVLSLLALLPTLFLREYTGFYILPFLALLAGFGIMSLLRILRRHPRMARTAVVASLIITTSFALGVLRIEEGRANWMQDSTYSTALYLRSSGPVSYVANDGLVGEQISAISGRNGLPVGGASTTAQSPELLTMGAWNASEVSRRERRIPLTSLTIEDDSPFILEGINALRDWVDKLLTRRVSEVTPTIVNQYRITYFVETDALRGSFTAFGNIYGSVFAETVHLQRFKVFDGSTEDLYLAFGSPN